MSFIHINPEDRNSYISSNYVSSWELKEGVREIVQNLMDAVTLHAGSFGGHKEDIAIQVKTSRIPNQNFREYEFVFQNKVIGLIEYNHIIRTLRCSNPGTIPIESLLMGGTEKNNMQSLEVIGRFGEGMKLAALALLRKNKTFLIRTGGQVWTFFLKEDPTFKKECLHFSIVPEESVEDSKILTTMVEIGNLSTEEWNQNIKHFLDLTDDTVLSVPSRGKTKGAVLLGTKLHGRLFVKGIHVQDLMNELKYGYNIIDIDLDRDRRCIPDVWNRYRRTSELLADVLDNSAENQRKYHRATTALNNMLFEVYDMLSKNHLDVYYFYQHVSARLADQLFLIFKSKLQEAGKNIDAMPIRPENVHIIEKEMRDQNVTSSIYPYEICSWMLYHTLLKSTSHYQTVQQRIDHYLLNVPDYQTTDAEKEIVNRVINKIRLIEPSFTAEQIIFKEQISYRLFFTAKNNIYLSKESLNENQIRQHESKWSVSSQYLREWKIFAVCTELLKISPFALLTHNGTFS